MVKNPPAMWETWVRSLSWEDPLEKGVATHSSILACRIQTKEPGGVTVRGITKSGTPLSDFHFTSTAKIVQEEDAGGPDIGI